MITCQWDIDQAEKEVAKADALSNKAWNIGKMIEARIKREFITLPEHELAILEIADALTDAVNVALEEITQQSRDILVEAECADERAYRDGVRFQYVSGAL